MVVGEVLLFRRDAGRSGDPDGGDRPDRGGDRHGRDDGQPTDEISGRPGRPRVRLRRRQADPAPADDERSLDPTGSPTDDNDVEVTTERHSTAVDDDFWERADELIGIPIQGSFEGIDPPEATDTTLRPGDDDDVGPLLDLPIDVVDDVEVGDDVVVEWPDHPSLLQLLDADDTLPIRRVPRTVDSRRIGRSASAPAPVRDGPIRRSSERDWRRAVGVAGRVLVTTSVLMLAFIVYQLWGTSIENAAAQRRLESEFENRLASLTVEAAGDVGDVTGTDPGPAGSEDATSIEDQQTDVPGAETEVVDDADADSTADETSTDAADEAAVAAAVDTPDSDATATESDGAVSAIVGDDDGPLPVADQVLPVVDDGAALFHLAIPAIGVDDIVVAGIGSDDLKQGPGHFPDTPLPGQLGNAAIAGHRTTYGQPFHDVDRLVAGDEITVQTWTGRYVYRVTGQQIVAPSRYEVITTTDPGSSSLTLISCHPKFTAQQRIVITAELDVDASDPVGVAVLDHGRAVDLAAGDAIAGSAADPSEPLGGALAEEGSDAAEAASAAVDAATTGDAAPATDTDVAIDSTPAATTDGTTAPATDRSAIDVSALASAEAEAANAEAFGEGWFADPGAWPQIALWGMVLAAIAFGAWTLSRRVGRDLVGAAAGIVPFVVCLYFFFQNVHRLLPPNL